MGLLWDDKSRSTLFFLSFCSTREDEFQYVPGREFPSDAPSYLEYSKKEFNEKSWAIIDVREVYGRSLFLFVIHVFSVYNPVHLEHLNSAHIISQSFFCG